MKAYTDIEQSKTLSEILPIESADMYYFLDPTPSGNIYHLTVQRVDVDIKNLPQYDEGDIPCWSLTALLSVLPNPILTQFSENKWNIAIFDEDNHFKDEYFADEPVDACYGMIVKLHEQKLL